MPKRLIRSLKSLTAFAFPTALAVASPSAAKPVQHPHHHHHHMMHFVPPGSTAECHDGFYTSSKNPKAGCAHHGGIASLLPPKA